MSHSVSTFARASKLMLAFLLAVGVVVSATIISAAPASAAWTQKRSWIGGPDLYHTSAMLSQKLPPSRTVYLTSGESGGDALAVPPAAAAAGAHVLMVRRDSVPSVIAQRLRQLQPRYVNIVGSRSVLSDTLWSQVRRILPSASAYRVGSADRVDSGIALLRHVARDNGGINDVFVIGQNGYSDGIATSSVAARLGAGLIPAMGGATAWAKRVAGELNRLGVDRVHFIGGTSVLSNSYLSALDARFNGKIDRIAGRDRYDTNARVVSRFVSDIGAAHAYLVAGNGHGDTIGASVLAARQNTVMMLSGRYCHAHDAVPAQIRRLGATHVVGIGTKHWIQTPALNLVICGAGVNPNTGTSSGGSSGGSAGGSSGGGGGGAVGVIGGGSGGSVYYANCDAVRRAGKAPLRIGQPGYRAGLDRDRDGVACE
ncbi:cell wall-binding repeat-containing protein [Agrococcus baldri]|nr:cell wall-binding repeat-containing protein [Agrococcus baldri]